MKTLTAYRLSIVLASLLLLATPAFSTPIGFSELSLMVRMHQSEADIKNDVAERKLLHGLTQPQENILKQQGASDSLLKTLRDSNLVVSKEEAAAAESATHETGAPSAEIHPGTHHPHVMVFDVAFGHSINLSQWGGLDYEIAFYSYRFAGEDHIQPALIDQVGSKTIVSRYKAFESEGEAYANDWFPANGARNWRYQPYNGVGGTLIDGRGDFRDSRFNWSDSVALTQYAVSRPVAIDWDAPVFFEGQAYTFYPVYGEGGVSLYYISSNSYSARVAVSVDERLSGGNINVRLLH